MKQLTFICLFLSIWKMGFTQTVFKFDLVFQGVDSNIKSEVLGYTGSEEIDISSMPKGDYILLVLYEGKVIHQDRIVISK